MDKFTAQEFLNAWEEHFHRLLTDDERGRFLTDWRVTIIILQDRDFILRILDWNMKFDDILREIDADTTRDYILREIDADTTRDYFEITPEDLGMAETSEFYEPFVERIGGWQF